MHILMICTGNICRSPTAEAVLRHHLHQQALHTSVQVDSAGTHDYHIGDPPDPRSIRTARAGGIEIGNLRARQLVAADFQRFDLLLAMDHGHLHAMQRLCPPGLRDKLRLYLEFAPDQPLREMPDPYYGKQDGFDLVLQLCHQASAGLIDHIRMVTSSSGNDRL
ncbi:low molecular weight protein-tyrosine-phosphatase [Ferrovibrio sp.]|uniref:low molecular weight protein-tyrosine-phosphatase n=1 Tax=Ferrovibrio sp. TaxID=1917215 RepID=UPI001B7310F6|nr:low molecular weight protein-tyrosine-phosphatase [Ferrovibrio sp.]MBP7064645.1 low molecular weight phosphotyrosine protein phosphatase [Ferrovibrio sp.]